MQQRRLTHRMDLQEKRVSPQFVTIGNAWEEGKIQVGETVE